jgi:CRP-like cAMP-binding protein
MSNRVSHSLVKALRRVPAFADLDEATLLELVGCSANLHWDAGRTVFERGDPAEGLYVVLSGRVRIVDPDDDHVVATIETGEYFGELSLMLDTTHSKTAIAGGQTELMVVPRESFRVLLEDRPELERQFRKLLDERLGLASASV